MIRMKH